ncbi:serine hydrolase domain-containing protein [Herpetosiphon sp. NSE202]|uniref:serine hydrolase domain-containing protein n=1 Tax=Herpetosiphon sp. NSE202 TaxID=3351349 RepID=UPI0036262EEC
MRVTMFTRILLAIFCLLLIFAGHPGLAATQISIDSVIQDFMRQSHVSGGAVAIIKNGEVIHSAGYGLDSLGNPVTPATPMRIASMSKSFTAVAIMQLVDEGKIELDLPLTTYLPEVTTSSPSGQPLMVRHLLNQTSGLMPSVSSEYAHPTRSSLAEAAADVHAITLATAPGTSFAYHNQNYMLAARVVEVVSGQPYAQYVQQHIFEPLAMQHSVETTLCSDPVPGLTNGHILLFNQAIAAPEPMALCAGSGGVVSTADDMAKWLNLHTAQGRLSDGTSLLSAASLATLHTPPSQVSDYAMGWHRHLAPEKTLIEHSGSLMTFTSAMIFNPATKTGVVVLLNTNSLPLILAKNLLTVVDGDSSALEPINDPRIWLDIIGVALTLGTLALGIRGIRRARAWATRLSTASAWIVGLRLLPYVLLPIIVGFLPSILRRGFNSDIDWVGLIYLLPMPSLFSIVLGLMLGAIAITRIRGYFQTRAKRPTPIA